MNGKGRFHRQHADARLLSILNDDTMAGPVLGKEEVRQRRFLLPASGREPTIWAASCVRGTTTSSAPRVGTARYTGPVTEEGTKATARSGGAFCLALREGAPRTRVLGRPQATSAL